MAIGSRSCGSIATHFDLEIRIKNKPSQGLWDLTKRDIYRKNEVWRDRSDEREPGFDTEGDLWEGQSWPEKEKKIDKTEI